MTVALPQYLILAGLVIMCANMVCFSLYLALTRSSIVRANISRFIVNFTCFICILILVISCQRDFSKVHLIQVFAILVFAQSVTASFSFASSLLQHRETQRRTAALLSALVGVIEARDPNLYGHSLNVRNLSLLLWEKLPLNMRLSVNAADLEVASLLLDVGKMRLPTELVTKGGKLSEDELEIIKRHPEIGSEILIDEKGFQKICEWIKYHHERVDGGGYYALKGREIPLGARIAAVTDTFSALVMERNYKPSLGYEEAIAELRLVAGKQLDSFLVERFCTISPDEIEASLKSVREKMQKYRVDLE